MNKATMALGLSALLTTPAMAWYPAPDLEGKLGIHLTVASCMYQTGSSREECIREASDNEQKFRAANLAFYKDHAGDLKITDEIATAMTYAYILGRLDAMKADHEWAIVDELVSKGGK